MQGDLIEACPVAVFKEDLVFDEAADLDGLLTTLSGGVGITHVQSIVMTQACDLEQGKIRNVILCPAVSLPVFKADWDANFLGRQGRAPNEKDWSRFVGDIRAGRLWNLTLLR